MRVALISDIHGNDVALRAVLADIRRRGVDQIVCLGDVATLGPSPQRTVDLVVELNCPCIMGNHDAFLLEPGLVETYTQAAPVIDATSSTAAMLECESHANSTATMAAGTTSCVAMRRMTLARLVRSTSGAVNSS